MSASDVLKLIEENEVLFVDFRFTDTKGKDQHISFPAKQVDEAMLEDGTMFDGSSISGWKGIQASDMIMRADTRTAVIDPFSEHKTLIIRCDIIEPDTGAGYERDPRSIANRAESYLKSTGIADTAFFGPEPEFFVFDGVSWNDAPHDTFLKINSQEGHWRDADDMGGANPGHRPGIKGGYFPVAPTDSLHDLRSMMCLVLDDMGVEVEVHHHEVANGGQCEIGTKFDTLVKRADATQTLKYVVHNVAHQYGQTATFMPKPMSGDNGSGMHVHMSLAKNGENLFAGDQYGGLSEMALYYIGGVIKHAHALNAFTNASVNSYKRLVPGYEAPVMLAYSARNRSASIRIPYVTNPRGRRVEVRFPDPTANPYLAFSALMMAGLDGIQNKIHPGEAMDKDLYDLPPEEEAAIPQVAYSLDQALKALDTDRDFLKAGGVFTDDVIDAYIKLKSEEVERMRLLVHPAEFDMYYSC